MKMRKKNMAFILLLAAWFVPCAVCCAAEQYQKILIVSSQGNETCRNLYRNICTAFNNVKLNYRNVDSGSYEIGDELKRLNSDDLVIIATNDFTSMVCKSDIVRFVAEGGMVFFPVLGTGSETILNLAGVKNTSGSTIVSGFNPAVKLFPGLEESKFEHMGLRSGSLQVTLEKNADVIVTAENKFPLVWRYSFGKGKILVLNFGLLTNARFCGVMMQLASLLNDYFITTVFNAKVIFIDNFPFPIPQKSDYVISGNYDGMTYEEFYHEVWWPQIKELAAKYRLKYTCLVLANQDYSVAVPHMKISDRMKEFIRYYGKDIMKNGHELGIHGYNNASLVLGEPGASGFKKNEQPWKSVQDMEASLACLKKTLDETLGKTDYFTYVPPVNKLSKEGKSAVLKVFPGIKCFGGIAGFSSDTAGKKGGILYQEAGMDPDFPEVYALPRNSNGEFYKAEEMWNAFNYIAYYGLFSHCFHSDNLMYTESSGNMNWPQLHESLDKIMGEVALKFPFLRPMTAREFVQERFRTEKIKVYSRKKGNEITVEYENGDGPLYHYLRLNNGMKVREIKNGTFRPIDADNGLYLLEGLKSPLLITLE
ncbi:MAG: DUF2194 domain-containing protein [Victivallales bacterium]|jgi:hypothetical protein